MIETATIQGVRPSTGFSEAYFTVRSKEKRIYSDEEVALLPDVDPSNVWHREWVTRKHSALRFRQYISFKKKDLKILEVGCGNGWFSNLLATLKHVAITGVDPHEAELEQAKRVFSKPNLTFHSAFYDQEFLEDRKFDIIFFAASAQYFSCFGSLVELSLDHLECGGEIHFMDSHFYNQKERQKAVARSKAYFEETGNAEMTQFYFHHTVRDLKPFRYQVMNRMELQFARMTQGHQIFPWVRIKNQ